MALGQSQEAKTNETEGEVEEGELHLFRLLGDEPEFAEAVQPGEQPLRRP